MAKLGVGGSSPQGWFHHHLEQPLRVSEQSQRFPGCCSDLAQSPQPGIFLLFKYLFIGLRRSSLQHVGSSSLTRDGTPGPPHQQRGVLATGPPGKSHSLV